MLKTKINMGRVKKYVSMLMMVVMISMLHPVEQVYAAAGDNALFTFVPLNGKVGENEVKLVINTDSAIINHLIFDIVDPTDALTFNIAGNSSDPIIFPLNGQAVLGTESAFTTASGDKGYDLASSDPFNTGSYSALHFATLVADKNLPTGPGGNLAFDTDTAIYVNTNRKGAYGADYAVLPNEAPIIGSPAVEGVSLAGSIVQPSSGNPVPPGLVQNVPMNANFTFSVIDNTDASVQRVMKIYKRLDDGSWNYSGTPSVTATFNRNGNDLTFSSNENVEFGTYYKVEFIATDDQTASDTETYYFSTVTDTTPPTQVGKAKMTFIGDSNDRTDIVSQISFTPSTDDDAVENYYLWTKSYLIAKNIINSDGTRDLALDTGGNSVVSDEEFYIGLRGLVNNNHYVKSTTAVAAGAAPYFRLTGNNVDGFDDNGTAGTTADDIYFVPDSVADNIFYIVAADGATTAGGVSVPNFSDFQIVRKEGDVFGSEIQITVASANYDYIVGDGSLDVWDAIRSYRNAIGLADSNPIISPDFIHNDLYNYPSNLTTAGASLH